MTSIRRSPRWTSEEHKSAWVKTFISWTTCSDENTINEHFERHPNDAMAAARSFITSRAPSKPTFQPDVRKDDVSTDDIPIEWIEKFKEATLLYSDDDTIDPLYRLFPNNVDQAIIHYREAASRSDKKRAYQHMPSQIDVGDWGNKSELTSHLDRHTNSHGVPAQQDNVKYKRHPLICNSNDISSDAFKVEDDNALSFLCEDKGVASSTVATATTVATTTASSMTAGSDDESGADAPPMDMEEEVHDEEHDADDESMGIADEQMDEEDDGDDDDEMEEDGDDEDDAGVQILDVKSGSHHHPAELLDDDDDNNDVVGSNNVVSRDEGAGGNIITVAVAETGDTADMDSIISIHSSSSDEVEVVDEVQVVGNSAAVLRGIVVCLSGQDSSRKEVLQDIIRALGGEVRPELNLHCVTHLVVDEDDYSESLKLCFLLDRRQNVQNVQQQHACMQIIICSSCWLEACYSQRSHVDEAPYSPSAIRLSSIMFAPSVMRAAGLEDEEEAMAAPKGSMIDHELLGDKETTVGDMDDDIKQSAMSLDGDGEEEEEDADDEEYLREKDANDDDDVYLHAGETSNVNSSRHQDRSHKKTTTTAETKKRMLLLGEMMSKYTRAPNVKPCYDAPSVPRSSVIEARAGTLSIGQALSERALRVQQGKKHMDLSLFQNGYLTVDELYAARLVQQFNSKFNRSVFTVLERAHSTNDCTEVTCTSCNQIIVRIRPQDWRPSNRRNTLTMLPQKLLVHTDHQCSKVCGTCGVSCRVLAREGQSSQQIGQHLRHCNEYSANLALYTKYVAATATFEITRPNCTKHQFNRSVLHTFTMRWLGGCDDNNGKYVLSRQRRDELEVLVPGALEYFSEKRESVLKKKEEALALPSYKCAVCSAVRKPPSKKSKEMVCLGPSCGVKGKQRFLSPKNWIEVEEEELDRKPAAK